MDISQNVWNEADASNNTAAPDGAPEGMMPSGVNDVIRADRGAIKRWYNQTIPKLTGGTSTAFTLTYGVAPTALADGMTHLVQFNQACGATPTLNVNGLGALPLHKYASGAWGTLAANNVTTDSVARVTYNAAAGAYRILYISGGFGSPITNSLSGNVALNNSANYFDGPSVAQGTVGTWFASGTVTLRDSASGATFHVKLWDGTTVIASAVLSTPQTNFSGAASLSGFIANPAGNLRISAKDISTTSGQITANDTSNGADSTITAIRLS
jgi:hypothetical protein